MMGAMGCAAYRFHASPHVHETGEGGCARTTQADHQDLDADLVVHLCWDQVVWVGTQLVL